MQAKLSFNNLNTFATAARTLSFQAAAELLYVTPSAVSHQIRNLESLLGYRLFERLDKHIRLTPEGERLYRDIRHPLGQLHEASYRALRGAESNNLLLSVAPVFATRWLLPRLRDFHLQHPETNLSVMATSSVVDFHVDRFDAAIRIGDGNWPGTRSVKLFGKCIVAVCNPRVIQAHGGPFEADELVHQPLVQNTAMPDLWQTWLHGAGVELAEPPDGFRVESTAQVLEAMASSEVIGLVDRHFIRDELASGSLALACTLELSSDDGYFLACPEDREPSAALQSFTDWIQDQAEAAEQS